MYRLTTLLALSLALPVAHAASLQEQQLSQLLDQVARESNVGTPRAISEDILDQGYTVENNQLVNHLSVQPRHAAQMRDNPADVRSQLAVSVCGNEGLRKLMSQGAVLRYDFSEYQSNKPHRQRALHRHRLQVRQQRWTGGGHAASRQAELSLCRAAGSADHPCPPPRQLRPSEQCGTRHVAQPRTGCQHIGPAGSVGELHAELVNVPPRLR